MAASTQSKHDSINGDNAHFNEFLNHEPSSFPNMDPSLTTGVEGLTSSAVAANAYNASFSQMFEDHVGTRHDESQNSARDDSTLVTSSTSLKPGKASRACDECRRRKSKCTDGNPETGQACAPCRARGGPDAQCHYNRTPMKRGPSKGYIQAMKGNVDDVSRGHRQVLRYCHELRNELLSVKDQLFKVVDFVQTKYGADALETVLHRDPEAKRLRFDDDDIFDMQILTISGQEAVSKYHLNFQSVLPFLPSQPDLLTSILEESSEPVHHAFEYALQAVHTPIYTQEGTINQQRADLIVKALQILNKSSYGHLYLASVGILMLAVQMTGPLAEYRGKLPTMPVLESKAAHAMSAIESFQSPRSDAHERNNYVRSVALSMRALLLITSIGTGEIFGIIDQIPVAGPEESQTLDPVAQSFSQLADTFYSVFRSGLASHTVDYEGLPLQDEDLPGPGYKIVALALKLLTVRLNIFADTPNSATTQDIITTLDDIIANLYTGADGGPSCWLYYHGLAIAVKTCFDLAATDVVGGDDPTRAANAAVEKIKTAIEGLPRDTISGWEQAAMNNLNKFSMEPASSSRGKWRDVLVKDAYLRALDF